VQQSHLKKRDRKPPERSEQQNLPEMIQRLGDPYSMDHGTQTPSHGSTAASSSLISTRSEPRGLLRRKALAVELDCSLRTIDNLQAEGMPCVFIGRSRRFILSEVIAWLKRKGGRA
jgi:hypothetical protein